MWNLLLSGKMMQFDVVLTQFLEKIFGNAACTTVRNSESVTGAGFWARTVTLSKNFLEPIASDFYPVACCIIIQEISVVVCVHEVHNEWLQMVSK